MPWIALGPWHQPNQTNQPAKLKLYHIFRGKQLRDWSIFLTLKIDFILANYLTTVKQSKIRKNLEKYTHKKPPYVLTFKNVLKLPYLLWEMPECIINATIFIMSCHDPRTNSGNSDENRNWIMIFGCCFFIIVVIIIIIITVITRSFNN